ncbi:MarR family winged helix-turn-helix transcriptional regulator [Actinoplanes sp. NPDC051859]|uniref:MarR family winged helix-turn-helix transcriptional regulator n=1 Tax=Actinoplanes sp. NPDC051859 TaxID=3363909 RepID=UPI00379CB9F5
MTDHDVRLAEAERLAGLLIGIVEQAKADFSETVTALGLSVPLARAIIGLTEPVPMRDLACELRCDRSYITSLADQLEERGLLTRVPGEDRRVKLLALTDAGRAVRDQVAAAVADRHILLRRLTDDERRVLTPLLERLHGDGTPPSAHTGGFC